MLARYILQPPRKVREKMLLWRYTVIRSKCAETYLCTQQNERQINPSGLVFMIQHLEPSGLDFVQTLKNKGKNQVVRANVIKTRLEYAACVYPFNNRNNEHFFNSRLELIILDKINCDLELRR